MLKKLIAACLLAGGLNGCSVGSVYMGFFRGGEDLAHSVERNYSGGTEAVLAPLAFIGGTVAGPFVAFYWGVQSDAHTLVNLHTLSRGYLDIDNDYYTLTQFPFSGPWRVEEDHLAAARVDDPNDRLHPIGRDD